MAVSPGPARVLGRERSPGGMVVLLSAAEVMVPPAVVAVPPAVVAVPPAVTAVPPAVGGVLPVVGVMVEPRAAGQAVAPDSEHKVAPQHDLPT